MNLEELVTKDYLESRLDVRFAEQRAYTETQFPEMREQMNTRFAEERSYMNKRLAERQAHTDSQFAKIEGKFTTLYWILTIVVASTVVPQLERLINF